jgi:Domain of unknown function (DUF4252)
MLRPAARVAVLLLMLTAPYALFAQGAQQPPMNWVPQGFEALGQRAAFHTDFTFDRSMLQLAGYFVGDADQEARNAIAKLNGISVHSYHFAAPGLYDPRALDLVRRQYEAAGWKHLVAAHDKGDPFNAGQTDLWINFAHMDVTGMMVLFAGPKDLNLIAFNGDISTVDLLHLRGHFGIPRVHARPMSRPNRSSRWPTRCRNPLPSNTPRPSNTQAVSVSVSAQMPRRSKPRPRRPPRPATNDLSSLTNA